MKKETQITLRKAVHPPSKTGGADIERIKFMDAKKVILFTGDKMGIAAALVRTAAIAVENKEVFMEDGQAVAVTLEAAGTELRKCRNVMEAYLRRKAGSRHPIE